MSDPIQQGIRRGAFLFGFLKAWRRSRRRKKRLRELGVEDQPMLNGYKTYLGIATAAVGVVLGWFGVGESEAATLSAQIVGAIDQVLTVAGLALAAYGRAKAASN